MTEQSTPRDDLGYPFTLDEYGTRLGRVREAMREADIDVLLVTGPENIYYVSGYHTTGYYIYQALVLPLEAEPRFVVRRLEFTNVRALSWIKDGYGVADTDSYLDATVDCIQSVSATARIGYDDQGFFLPAAILDGMRSRMTGSTFVPAGGLIEKVRMIKSPAEIAYIRQAALAAVAGVEAGMAAVRAGVTENDVAAVVYDAMVRAGSEYMSSPPYVSAGARSARGHASFERYTIQPGEVVFFEVGGSVRRYGGAIMRTVSVGAPSDLLEKAAAASIGALDALLEAARPGATSGEVDRAGRSVVERAGLGECWLHRTGYSIGVGFPPGWGEGHIIDLKPDDPRVLEPGMTFHSVPQLLVPGVGSVGFSETWRVTEDGVEVLTDSPRELRVV